MDRPEPRLLMQGIFLKLAFGIPWNDLPDLFRQMLPQSAPFPLRAARDLYRQLYLSGRMTAIYRRLAWHLRVHGGTTAAELVESGAFFLDGPRTRPELGRRIRLAPETELTWQTFTALLLLQRAFHNYRVFVREQSLDRRGVSLRLPPPPPCHFDERSEESPCVIAGRNLPPRPPITEYRQPPTTN
jgi:hypothetical protein